MIWSNVPPGAYSLTAIAIDNRSGSSRSDPIAIKVLDPCRLPVVTIEAVDRFAAEQDPRIDSLPDTATFRVKRTCVANTPLTVFLDISGTASNGVDYLFLREHVTIPAGAPSADIVVEAIDDLLVEGVETVVVRIESPVCLATDPAPAGCYLVGRPSQDVASLGVLEHGFGERVQRLVFVEEAIQHGSPQKHARDVERALVKFVADLEPASEADRAVTGQA